MDTWQGINSDPITLHKYLYANVDPVNNIDPSGNFSIGSVMSALNTVSNLVTRAQSAISLFNIATGEEELTAKQVGFEILASWVAAS